MPAFADDLEDAQAAFAAGDYQEARLLVRPLLMEGNAEAQYLYGRMLEEGAGVPLDVEQAKEYYRKAAAQGHAEARARLEELTGAEVQVEGESVAVDWFREAAEEGDPEAQFNYAHALESGWGTARDEAAARRWFARAAKADHDGAQLRLGMMLVVGAGGPPDPAAGVRWLREAARNGNPVAEALVQDVLDARGPLDDTAVRLIGRLREAVWEGDEIALEHLQSLLVEAAEAPSSPAATGGTIKVPSAVMRVESGSGSPVMSLPDNVFQVRTDDPVRLRDLVAAYRRAAEAGDMEAQFALAVLYLQGRGLPKDRQRGMAWMRRSAEQGYLPAQSYLYLASGEFGALPLHGSILLDWARERALAWDPQAFYLLGRIFETGRGVVADVVQARRWYQLAALMGVEVASIPMPVEPTAEGGAENERSGAEAWMAERWFPATVTVALIGSVGFLAWWRFRRRRRRFLVPPRRRGHNPFAAQERRAGGGAVPVRDLRKQDGDGGETDVPPAVQASSVRSRELAAARAMAGDPLAARADGDHRSIAPLADGAFVPLAVTGPRHFVRGRDVCRHGAAPLPEEPHLPAAPRFGPGTAPATSKETPPLEGSSPAAEMNAGAPSPAAVQFNIGLMFANGDGVPKNPVQAAKWFEKAARQGHADAQFRLGGLYWTGELGEKDVARALEWLQRAAASGHRRARGLLAKIRDRHDQGSDGTV